jgi:hypothetical protein
MSSDNLYHVPVVHERIKTEHAGAKNGGGVWMTRAAAKEAAKRQRHRTDEIDAALSTNEHADRWATANAHEAIREEQW